MLFSEAKWQNGLASYCIFVTKTPSVKQHSKEIVFIKLIQFYNFSDTCVYLEV